MLTFGAFNNESAHLKTLILNIETTTKNCSVSLSENGVLLALKEINDGNYSHAENLHPFIDSILLESKKKYTDLSAIAVSKGPGSYTGLRIGVSAAKGFCFALGIPLIATDTLQALAMQQKEHEGLIVALLDARRMEVYQAVFNSNYQNIEKTRAVIVAENTYKKYLEKESVLFTGDAVAKIQNLIQHPNARFVEAFPSAREMAILSYQKFKKKEWEDLAYFEPYYLKDFIAVKSHKKYF